MRIVADRASSAFAEIVPSRGLAARAVDIAVRLDHPVYECLYPALAELRDACPVTVNRKLLSAVGDAPLRRYVAGLEQFEPMP